MLIGRAGWMKGLLLRVTPRRANRGYTLGLLFLVSETKSHCPFFLVYGLTLVLRTFQSSSLYFSHFLSISLYFSHFAKFTLFVKLTHFERNIIIFTYSYTFCQTHIFVKHTHFHKLTHFERSWEKKREVERNIIIFTYSYTFHKLTLFWKLTKNEKSWEAILCDSISELHFWILTSFVYIISSIFCNGEHHLWWFPPYEPLFKLNNLVSV